MQTDLPAAMAELIAGVTRVRVIDGGVLGGQALGDRVLGEFVREDAAELLTLLAIEQPTDSRHCLCHGNPALELWAGERLRATLGVHHGIALRVVDWWSDARLLHGEALLRWLADHNITTPLAAALAPSLAAKAKSRRATARSEAWLAAAPALLLPRLAELDGGGWILPSTDLVVREAMAALRAALGAGAAAALLAWYGGTGSPWSGFPPYESVAVSLLRGMPLDELLAAGDTEDETVLLGLVRYLCNPEAPAHEPRLLDARLRERFLGLPRIRIDPSVRTQVSALLNVSLEPRHDGALLGKREHLELSRPVACAEAWVAVDREFVVRFDPGRTVGTVRASMPFDDVALGAVDDEIVVALTTHGEVWRIPLVGGERRIIAERQMQPIEPTGLHGRAVWLEQPRFPGGLVGTRLRIEGSATAPVEHAGRAWDLSMCCGALWWARSPAEEQPKPCAELVQWDPETGQLQIAAVLEVDADDPTHSRLSTDGERLAWASGQQVGVLDPRTRRWKWFDLDARIVSAHPCTGGVLVTLARGYIGELVRIGDVDDVAVLARWDRALDEREQLAVRGTQVVWNAGGDLWTVELDAPAREAHGSPATRDAPRDKAPPAAASELAASEAPLDGVFLAYDGVCCSRSDIPEGRLILAEDGLYFIPGVVGPDATAPSRADPWLSGAMLDDEDSVPDLGRAFLALRSQPPAAQLAAVASSLHFTPEALGTLDIHEEGREQRTLPSGQVYRTRTLERGPTVLTLTFADGREPLRFTMPTFPFDALRSWSARMGQLTTA